MLPIVCAVAGTFAVISVLWLLRAHYFNATNAGWGDREQDRHQWLLRWGVRISFAVALICIAAVATISKRVFASITAGMAISLTCVLVARSLPVVSAVLGFPGMVAALYTFGVHNGGGFDVTSYAAVINAVVYSGTGFPLLHNKVFR
jgi:hypothetical protein